ncbi:MAG: transcriptional regulator [Terracidiphilus sp.]
MRSTGDLLTPAADRLYVELWVSLASLLRSYTAAHGLNRKTQATVELGEERILVRHGDDWIDLRRTGSRVNWRRANGGNGTAEMTEAGRLRSAEGEEEMDMAAERWARELMR